MKSRTANIKQKFLVQFGSDFIGKILTMAAGIFVARLAGPEVVGTLSYATSYVMVFTVFVGIFGPGHVKLMSETKEPGNCVATYSRLQLICYAAWFLLVLGWFLVEKYLLVNRFENSSQEVVILITLVAMLLTYLYDFNNSTFTGRMEQAKANYPLLVNNVLYNIGRIIIVFIGFKAIALASWNLVTSLLCIPLAYRLFTTLPWGNWDRDLFKKYIGYGIPALSIHAIDVLTKYSDKLVLYRYTSASELGYYTAAMSIGGLILLSGRSIAMIFFPLFSLHIAENNWAAVNKKIMDFENFIATFMLPAICLLAIIGKPFMVLLLGAKYLPSVGPFKLLLFSSYLTLIGMPYGNIISGMGRFYLAAWINFVKFIVYVLAIFIFVSPDFLGLGAIGLAWNLLVVNLVNNALFFLAAKKIGHVHIGFNNSFRQVIILTVSAGFYFISLWMARLGAGWWLLLIPIYLSVTYGVLHVTGFLQKTQVDHLKDLLKIKKTVKYFREEVRPENEK